ncbi:MAG: hypothetical protein RBT63_02210 [Bdellovibrionales bacterium]|jgi:hypothetical protein|nr:hypothetical protein [Bdellovibrionales bacterium]
MGRTTRYARYASLCAALCAIATFGLTACGNDAFSVREDFSEGGPKRDVKIDWPQSVATDVARSGGGYRVYIRRGSAPTETNTTPIRVENPGDGTTHVTTLTTKLSSGTHYISIQAYSNSGKSALSSPITLKVD